MAETEVLAPEASTTLADTTALPSAEPEKEQEIVALETDPQGVKERFSQYSKRVKQRDEKIASVTKELETLRNRSGSAERFIKWFEDRGYSPEQIVAQMEKKPETQAAPPSPASSSKDELAKKMFQVEKFDDLAEWEKEQIETKLWRQEFETKEQKQQETLKQQESKNILATIAKECVDILKTDDFKDLKTNADDLYKFMADTGIADTEVAAMALYKDDLRKSWMSKGESIVASRKSKAPGSLETTTAVQPTEEFLSKNPVERVLEKLRSEGRVDKSILR